MKIKKCTIEHFRLLSRATIDFRGGNLGGNRWQRYTLFNHFYKNCHFIIKIINYCILYQKKYYICTR